MKPGIKRGLKITAAVLAVIVAIPVGLVASAFVGTSDIEDGRELSGHVHIVKDGHVTVGILSVGGGKVALVDAGNDPRGAALLADLARLELGPDAVEAILLTHGHPDHTAGCHAFPAAKVYALAADVALVEGREGGHGPLTRLFPMKPTGIRVTRTLADGEVLAVGDTKVKVFAIPGHTAGSAAYLVDGVLFLGDSATATKEGKLNGAPWAFSDDAPLNRASLKALAERMKAEPGGARWLAPAHTGVLQGLEPLAAFAASL